MGYRPLIYRIFTMRKKNLPSLQYACGLLSGYLLEKSSHQQIVYLQQNGMK